MLMQALKPIRDDLARMEESIAKRSICGIGIADTIIGHMTQNSGKRIRPAVFLLAASTSNGTENQLDYDLTAIAAAIELVHTASLLHDDVVDRASIRRGMPTANAKWGDLASVLTGDFLWCAASEIIVQNKDHRLTSAVIEGVRKMTQGEILELALRNDISIDEMTCLRIMEAKTASLFSTAARLGAIVSGLSEDHERAFMEYGRCVGMAFQLADDALDYSASKASLGKEPKADLITKTPTYPLVAALKRASSKQVSIIDHALKSKSMDLQTLREVSCIVDKCGGLKSSLDLANQYTSQAKEHLAGFKSCVEIDSLKAIADYASDRDS